jgi:hypothetical protein
MLSSGGVGYFEYQAQVRGDATLSLPVRLDQADDVLKSIVVFDDKGGAGAIQLPSRAPLSDIFRGLPFGPSALDSGAELLAALKGAEISVDGPVSIDGRIVSVTEETAKGADGLEITRHRVTAMTSGGLRQFVLEAADGVTFKDPLLRSQIDQALTSVSEHREGQGRMLTIRAKGEGSRTVTVAFVAETPLWKASYRVTTAADQAKAWLQGWAVLENVSGVDWRDVELTLATGNPVTFRQQLYATYYVQRPEVPVEILGRILPPADDGAVAAAPAVRPPAPKSRAAPVPAAPPAPPPPPPLPMSRAMADEAAPPPELDVLAGGAPASDAKESATQVTFTLPNRVTVLNGQSLSVPIVNKQASAQRIGVFQPATHPRHPLAAVQLNNDTGSSLPPGVITLYDQDAKSQTSYVGDARMSAFPAGETRLLSFALDTKVTVDLSRAFDKTVTKISLANGVLRAAATDIEEAVYTIKGAANEPRSLILEHERRPGWSLTAPDPKGVDMTPTAFRLPVSVKAGETQTFKASTEWVRDETLAAVNLAHDTFLLYANNARLTPDQRAAFARMAALRKAADDFDPLIAAANSARDRALEEQERIRENIKAVPGGTSIQARYIRALNDLEDEFARYKQTLGSLEARKADAEKALADYIATLTF